MSGYFRDVATRALGMAPLLTSTAFFVRDDAEGDQETFEASVEPTSRTREATVEVLHTVEPEVRVEIEQNNHQQLHTRELHQTELHSSHESERVREKTLETTIREVVHQVNVERKETLRDLLREAHRETIQRTLTHTERLERHTHETAQLLERATEREIRHTERIERLNSHVRTEFGVMPSPPAEPTESTVNISIGRIEIRPTGSNSKASATNAPTRKSGISLEDYLRERNGGSR